MKLSHNSKAKGMVRYLRRYTGILLCLALFTGSMAGAQPAAGAEQGGASEAADAAVTYMMEGATLTHEVLSAWEGGYNAQVTITNTGSGTIENWGIKMSSAEGTGIDSIWNAVIQKESGQGSICYDISNPGWGRDIAPGASVSFGYQGRTDTTFGGNHAPLGCSLAGKQHEAQQGDYRLWYRIVEDWQSGGIIETTVQNLTEKDMENWKFSFAWQDVQIEEIWDASLTEGEEERYHVINAGYNYTVPAQGSVAFRMKVEADMGGLTYPQDGMLSYDDVEAGDTPVSEEPAQSLKPSTPATSPAVAATEPAAETPEPEATEEMRCWNRTMLHMDDAGVKKALTEGEGSVKVALLDSGVDEMEGILVAGRVSLLPGEEEMTELYEDATGHGTAVASVMAYHYKDDEELLEEKIEEYNEQFYAGEGEALFGEEEAGILQEDDMQEVKDEDAGTEEDAGLGELIIKAQARFEGINPEMELYSVRVLDEYNEAPAGRVIEGIRWARENGIRIINISFGTTKDYEELHKEIKKAYKEGILVIAATGNDGRKQYPAAYKEVLGVGSVDCTGQVQECCKEDVGIELSAPGEGVLSVGSFGVETEAEGTSMAAGEVTAIASILWKQNPALSNKFIRSLLAAGANPCDGSRGYGIVDPAKSLAICEDFLEAYEEAADIDFAEAGEGTEPTVPGKKEEAALQDVDALLAEADIEKEEEQPATTEALVRACWGGKTHLNLVKKAAKNRGLQGNTLQLLKIGARLQDGMLCNLNDKKKFPTWHGYFKDINDKDANYVAGYMYLTRLAKKINEEGVYELGSDKLWDSVIAPKKSDTNNKGSETGDENGKYMQGVITKEGINYNDKEKNKNLLDKNSDYYEKNGIDLEDVAQSSWRNIFRSRMGNGGQEAGKEDALNAEPVMVTSRASVGTEAAMEARTEQALVVYGMGLHTLTDTFAHSCRAATIGSVSGKSCVQWRIMSKAKNGELGEGKEEKYNDSTKVVPNRTKAAALAAANALNHIKYKKNKLTIESSEVTDFYSKDSSEVTDIVQLKNYIRKKNGKYFAIMPSYLEKAFAVKNLQQNMEECKEDIPGYIENLDLKAVKGVCAQHKVVYFKTNVKKGKKIKLLIKCKDNIVLRQNATVGEYMYVIVQKDLDLNTDYSISYIYKKKETKIKKEVPKKKKSPARMQQTEEEDGMLLEEAQVDYPQTGENKFGSVKRYTSAGKIVRVSHPRITLEREDGSKKYPVEDGYGFYNFTVANGAYSITVEKEGYMPLKKYLYAAGSREEYMDDLFLYPVQEGDGNLEGKITDGPSGTGVSGLYLKVREGYDNTEGKVTASAYTDAAGNYTLQDIPTGYYCVEFEDRDLTRLGAGEGYEDNYFNVFIESGKTGHKNSFVCKRFGAQKTLELVVYWTKPEGVQQPSETLSLYLFGRRGAKEMCLYDGNYQKTDGELVAETVFNREFVPWDETKRMSSRAYIYDCTRTGFMFYVASSRGGHYLPLTDAVAEIYYDGKLIQSFALPQGEENYWDVCTYDAETGEFTPGDRLMDYDTFYDEAWDRLLYLAYGEEKPDED